MTNYKCNFDRLNKMTIKAKNKAEWGDYLLLKRGTLQQKEQMMAIADMFDNHKADGYKLYHMTVTYKPEGRRDVGVAEVNRYFKNFYLNDLLKYIVNSSRTNSPSKRLIQPITFSFLDEHEQNYGSGFVQRFHHHAIMAVHEATVERMDRLNGVNTLVGWGNSKKIMTSHVRECDAMCSLYANKMHWKYCDDYLVFSGKHNQH